MPAEEPRPHRVRANIGPMPALDTATPMSLGADTRLPGDHERAPGLIERWRGRRGLILEALGVAWLPWLTARAVTLLALGLARYEVRHFHITNPKAVLETRDGLLGSDAGWYQSIAAHGYGALPQVGHPVLPAVAVARPRPERRHLADRRCRLAPDHQRGQSAGGDRDLRAGLLRTPGQGPRPARRVADDAGAAGLRLRDGVLGGAPRPAGGRLLRRHPAGKLVVGRPVRVPRRNGAADRVPPDSPGADRGRPIVAGRTMEAMAGKGGGDRLLRRGDRDLSRLGQCAVRGLLRAAQDPAATSPSRGAHRSGRHWSRTH